jgi:hypothetical protein
MLLGIRRQFIVLVLIVLISVSYTMNVGAYTAGLLNSGWLIVQSVVLFVPMLVLAHVCLVYELYDLFRTWPTSTTKAKRMRVLLIFMSVIVLFGSFVFYRPWWARRTQGFRRRLDGIKFERHVPIVREWLSDLASPDGSYPELIPLDACATEIRNLKPRRVWLDIHGETNTKLITFSWGGAFLGSWGLTVGPPSLQTPKSSERKYVLPWVSGAYVWHAW